MSDGYPSRVPAVLRKGLALIVLDVYAKTVDLMIEKPLASIRKFFDAYFGAAK